MSEITNAAEAVAIADFITSTAPAEEKRAKPFHQRKKVRKFSTGVMEKMTANVLFAILTLAAGGAAVYFAQPTTSTPSVYIDTVTGCQYLTTGAGITPRLNKLGTQICLEK